MKVLLFDTSSEHVVVGLVDDHTLVAHASEPRPAQQLLAVVDTTLRSAQATLADVDAIAVGTGPGGFTGLRIGVTTARALSRARQIQVAPLPTLAAIAQPAAAESTGEHVWALADAKRGEVFARSYRWLSGIAGFTMVPASDLNVVARADVESLVADERAVWGPPTPEGMAALVPQLSFGDASDVSPQYGREPDIGPPAASPARARAGT